MINILCDTALVYGFASRARLITADVISEVIEDKQNFGVFSPGAGVETV